MNKQLFKTSQFIKSFSENGQLGGILLLLATTVSLVITNSSQGESYLHFWETTIGTGSLALSVEAWVNDALMVVFFFLVGIEIKRELQVGELSSMKQALLPIVAALGGLITPALIFLAFNHGTAAASGWAIPTSTDIAFSLAVLSLVGNRVPLGLKVFLTALAIIDDLGAILIIAFFYTEQLQWVYLGLAAAITTVLIVLSRLKIRTLYAHWFLGIILWYCILQSGIHATLAGVILAFTIPLEAISGLEHRLNKPVNYLLLPLFALANTTIHLSAEAFQSLLEPMELGIFLGLLLGKPLGISLASFLLIQSKAAALPLHTNWKQMAGAGVVAGIGFTMSIFLTNLSFSNPEFLNGAKLSIILTSFTAGLLGFILLRWATKPMAYEGSFRKK
ncbi:Na+/H+ antiporter NhaA [Siphonobacter sp. SORGH_AS_0500]|uniref:Na+/H+ antiporter NhaA n=1 Tax=Siphonobacter sp. SORGH_AS_0500 TaxID=1864824 RepID=UPI000CACEC10|nr:Na+/H+ antiporter NhaA [Siphonobacter sp. SORGH_AS_0500]PKK38072.1 Na+/H+ antiporter NhaA [Siphonobacter sp. SORGH_AS_0500]